MIGLIEDDLCSCLPFTGCKLQHKGLSIVTVQQTRCISLSTLIIPMYITCTLSFKSLWSLKKLTYYSSDESCQSITKHSQGWINVLTLNNNFVLLLSSKNPSICSTYSLAGLWSMCWCNLKIIHYMLPEAPPTGWWGLIMYPTVKLLPQQLSMVEVWWMHWPFHHRQHANWRFLPYIDVLWLIVLL